MGSDVVFVTYDQAHFTIDADVRRCWAPVGSKPIVYKNGSKKSVNIGGAYSSTNEFFYYRMERQIKEEVRTNLAYLRLKFPNMFLLLDKATWNKNKWVMNYLEHHNIPYMFFPTGAPDLNPTEFCWELSREEVTANISHSSEDELFNDLKAYWDKNPFKHNPLNYLDY